MLHSVPNVGKLQLSENNNLLGQKSCHYVPKTEMHIILFKQIHESVLKKINYIKTYI